jgi:hypothetical protein
MHIELPDEVAADLKRVCHYLHMEDQMADAASAMIADLLETMESQPEMLSWLAEQVTYANERKARAGGMAALWAVSCGGTDFERCDPQHVEVQWIGGQARLHALDIIWERETPPFGLPGRSCEKMQSRACADESTD